MAINQNFRMFLSSCETEKLVQKIKTIEIGKYCQMLPKGISLKNILKEYLKRIS